MKNKKVWFFIAWLIGTLYIILSEMNVKDDGFGLAGAIAFVAWIFFTMIVMVIHSISSIPKTGGRSDYYKKLIALLLILAFIIFGGLALLGFIK